MYVGNIDYTTFIGFSNITIISPSTNDSSSSRSASKSQSATQSRNSPTGSAVLLTKSALCFFRIVPGPTRDSRRMTLCRLEDDSEANLSPLHRGEARACPSCAYGMEALPCFTASWRTRAEVAIFSRSTLQKRNTAGILSLVLVGSHHMDEHEGKCYCQREIEK